MISPLLANVYLHYVFDLWAQQWRRREASGDLIIVRYADDLVVGFEHEADARRFWDSMREWFARFALELHGEKTQLLEFGRYAIERRQRQGLGKPPTFNFLGFTFICGRSRRGAFLLRRHTRRDRMRAALQAVKDGLLQRRHASIPEQGEWLRSVVAGYFAYHAVPTNAQALCAYRHHVLSLWRCSLEHRNRPIGKVGFQVGLLRGIAPWGWTRHAHGVVGKQTQYVLLRCFPRPEDGRGSRRG